MRNKEKNDLYLFYINSDEEKIADINREISSFSDKYNNKGNLYSDSNKEILTEILHNTFKKIFIIVVNYDEISQLFNEINQKANTELYSSLKIIILLNVDDQNDQEKKEEILKQYESIKNDKIYDYYPFFDPDLICQNIEELKNCLKKKKKNQSIVAGTITPKKVILTTINNKRDMNFVLDFHKLLSEPSADEIQKFQNDLAKKYKDQQQYLELTNLIKQNMHINIINIKGLIAKYWLKLYSYNLFSDKMNDKLGMKCGNFYNVYIRLLYFALKNRYLTRFKHQPNTSIYLILKKEEIDEKDNNENENDTKILYCRSFLLFHTKKENQIQNNERYLILQNDTPKEIICNGVEMEKFTGKQDVLFFPYSCFKIKSIHIENGIKNYILGYLNDEKINNDVQNQVENVFKKDFITSNIPSDRLIKETDPSLLDLKIKIIGEFKINKKQVGQFLNLINPNKSNIEDYVEILEDSGQKLLITEKFKKNKKYKIHFNFSENFNNFTYLFQSIEINSLDLSKLKMENITNVASMFLECKNLTSIDLSNKKINYSKLESESESKSNSKSKKKVFNCSSMFFNCLSLKSVNLENFTLMKIEKMDYMFYKCKSLKHINLKNLNTEGASINNIFFGVNKKCKIEVENDKIKDEFNKIKNK